MPKLPLDAYAARRRAVLDRMPEGAAILLPTHVEQVRSNTTHFPFRPASDFWYLTGFPEPDAWALLKRAGTDAGFHLFVQPKDPERERWTGTRHGVEGATSRFSADHAWPLADLDKELSRLLEDVHTLYFPFARAPGPNTLSRLHGLLDRVRVGRKAGLGPATLVDASAFLSEMRLRKSEAELALMREGARITGEAHVAAMQAVRPGMHEYEIQALIEYTFRRQGAWGSAYGTIVAGGANACVLHYVHNDAELKEGELMLVDAGAEIDGYASDVTRTTPVSGRYEGAAREIYEAVLGVQEATVASVRPGASINGIHAEVLRRITGALVDLGILHGEVEALVEDKAYELYYMHRTSHWIGLDVHDVGRYVQMDGDDVPLEPGMVITVEPGLYLSPDDETVPAVMRGIGVRIEDDVLVTPSGHENLTAHIPKRIGDVEALRG
jgi:Xaa-Pro aminopeptidase